MYSDGCGIRCTAQHCPRRPTVPGTKAGSSEEKKLTTNIGPSAYQRIWILRYALSFCGLIYSITCIERKMLRVLKILFFSFHLDQNFLKCVNFLLVDIRVGGQRHLVIVTPFQRQLLSKAKRWFLDGTFKVE